MDAGSGEGVWRREHAGIFSPASQNRPLLSHRVVGRTGQRQLSLEIRRRKITLNGISKSQLRAQNACSMTKRHSHQCSVCWFLLWQCVLLTYQAEAEDVSSTTDVSRGPTGKYFLRMFFQAVQASAIMKQWRHSPSTSSLARSLSFHTRTLAGYAAPGY